MNLMTMEKLHAAAEIFSAVDIAICRLFNRASRRQRVERFFAIVSRLGNGVFWYTLMTALPLIYGMAALDVSLHMAIVGASGLLLYKIIKRTTERLRPFMVDDRIHLGTMPLDKYSFPSGHTLHATSFSMVVAYDLPELFWLVVPFAVLVAISRIILGLHYPTDVIAGSAIGAALALAVLPI